MIRADFGYHNADGYPCDSAGQARTYPDGRPFVHEYGCAECARGPLTARFCEAASVPTMSPYVRRALAHTLPAKELRP